MSKTRRSQPTISNMVQSSDEKIRAWHRNRRLGELRTIYQALGGIKISGQNLKRAGFGAGDDNILERNHAVAYPT